VTTQQITLTAPVPAGGTIIVPKALADGDVLTATVHVPVVVNPLVISKIVVTPTTTGAQVAWHVSEYATGQLQYGLTAAYGTYSPKETSFNYQDHVQHIAGMPSGKLVHFRILAADAAGNQATSPDQTFTTLGGVVAPPPAPTNLKAVAGDGYVDLSWNAVAG
jgi:hypothetical protein